MTDSAIRIAFILDFLRTRSTRNLDLIEIDLADKMPKEAGNFDKYPKIICKLTNFIK